ncbi:hypothetical protein GCM10025883_38460 [Mobilicoccus caccae]|uniref:DNA gyrase subunit A n=1 Tax=Mobilicoccus caccae TaxID=1859295 RepID=A0ABQ6IW24_9MICO|nr:hypothetical protein GCM10025883_38460 [Mobilicoccus caccae]
MRFHASDDILRPMGRATSGVTGMKFRADDDLLAMSLIREGQNPDVFVVFENGLAKRTPASDYPVKGRAGLGVRVAAISERGGDLVGSLVVDESDEVMVVMEKGKVVRSRVDEVRRTGRNTMGVQFAKPDAKDSIVKVARNPERAAEEVAEAVEAADAEGTEVSVADAADVESPVDAVPSENAAGEPGPVDTDEEPGGLE